MFMESINWCIMIGLFSMICDIEKFCCIITCTLWALIITCPSLLQIIFISLHLADPEQIIFIVGCVQTGCAIYGALSIGYHGCKHDERPCRGVRTLFMGSFSLCYLIPWVSCNVICSWIFLRDIIHGYTQLMVYLPIIMYIPLPVVGYWLNCH
jgi:hypothetical protein